MKKILLAYDGTLNSKAALRYGLLKAREEGGQVTVLNVFDSARFVDYPHLKAEEAARAEMARCLDDARVIIEQEGAGVPARVVQEEGNPEEEIPRYAREFGMDLIIAPPALRGLLKTSPCPLAIVPGYILFPVDDKEVPASALEKVIKEARASGSRVILAGIIPEHIYGKLEKEELERIRKDTSAMIMKARAVLAGEGIEVMEVMRSGYPDEELMYVAEEFPVTLMIIPARREEASELTKAAAIIMDESERVKRLVVLAA